MVGDGSVNTSAPMIPAARAARRLHVEGPRAADEEEGTGGQVQEVRSTRGLKIDY
jgi:hypothetical protein